MLMCSKILTQICSVDVEGKVKLKPRQLLNGLIRVLSKSVKLKFNTLIILLLGIL